MSNDHVNGEPKPLDQRIQEAKRSIQTQITITVFEDGNLSVDGPWDDRIRFEGTMSVAFDSIQFTYRQLANEAAKRHAIENAPRIQPVSYYEKRQIEKETDKHFNKGG